MDHVQQRVRAGRVLVLAVGGSCVGVAVDVGEGQVVAAAAVVVAVAVAVHGSW